MAKAKAVKGKGRAKGEPPRTARVRYVEPPTKKDGNPFFALRVPGDVLRAFKAKAKARKLTPTELVRTYMAKVAGVALSEEGEE